MPEPGDETIDTAHDHAGITAAPADEETLPGGAGVVDRPAIKWQPDSAFGDYELIEEIARGGMGVVFKARHRTLNRVVALKMILSGQFASEADVRRFYAEAEAAANLDHPGIVPIYDIGAHEGRHFFSMKLVEGGSLAERLSELRSDRRRVVQLVAEIARAIHHAHQRGILHRDLKPANVLLDEAGSPMVSDLGLAKQIKSDSALTHTGAGVGTPAYMSPEQASAKKEITTACDIYSLGAILYEALTGRPPHQGESAMEVMMRVVEGRITPPRELDAGIDRSLELICLKCLETEPARRYSSAAALAEDLDNWLEGRPVSVKPPSLGSTLTMAVIANLRSIVGAGLIGAVAGILFSFCLSQMNSDSRIVAHPPDAVYEQLPGPIPLGRSFVFLNETGVRPVPLLLGTAGVLGSLLFIGLILAKLTRARPGSEALAVGMFASLMMSLMLFVLHVGYGRAGSVAEPSRELIKVLTLAAFEAEPVSREARFVLLESYPGLAELAGEERAEALAYRTYYDGFFTMPMAILEGMAISVLICALPVLLGTIFGSTLLHQEPRVWRVVPAYAEFMVVTLMLVFCVFLQTLIPALGGNAPDYGLQERYGRQVVIYGGLGFVAWSIYRRRLGWKWRVAIYAGLIAVCVLVF